MSEGKSTHVDKSSIALQALLLRRIALLLVAPCTLIEKKSLVVGNTMRPNKDEISKRFDHPLTREPSFLLAHDRT